MPEIFFEVYSGKPVLSGIAVLYISLATLFFPSRTRYYLKIITIPLTSKLWEEEERQGCVRGMGVELIIVVLIS